jgi:hypothetical protein
MTSQNTSIYTPFSDGHTVRDIVEHTPALVNEAWCRTLLRHTLDSLEQQYASGAPHRPITPDTLVMLANGETLLLPAGEEVPEAERNLAADLRALALVVHYAITAELPPEGPLGPRLYDHYSAQLTRGLDSCLGPNKRLRPYTVEDMRTLLGIEAGSREVLAPAAPVAETAAPAAVEFVEPPAAVEPVPVEEPVTTAPLDPIVISSEPAARVQEVADPVPPEPISLREQAEAGMLRKPANRDPDAVQPPRSFQKTAPGTPSLHDSGPAPAAPRKPSAGIPPPAPDHLRADAGMQPARRRNSSAQRWGMIAGAALVVLAAGGALFSWMQQNDARDVVPLALPPAAPSGNGLDAGETVVAAPGATSAPAPAATTQPLEAAPAPASPAPADVPPPAGAAAQAAVQAAVSADEAIVNGTTYKLLIKPWGTVYVDGVDRGVSPPVKRLTLAPGQHTLRIVNPNFPDHVVTVDAGLRESATVQYDFRAQAQ